MSSLRITRLGHAGVLYRSPGDRWVWVDRWTGAPTYADAYRAAERVDVVAPTHGHFDHIGNDAADVVELASGGATVLGSHELQIYLAGRGVDAIGMNVGGTVEAAGIRFTMFRAVHTGGVTITGTGPDVTREVGCWGWLIEFEDGTKVYHSGDTDVFGDMAFVRNWDASIGVMPIGGHYTMDPAGAAHAVELTGVDTVIPVHYATFPVLAGTPAQLAERTEARVVELQPGETWEVKP